MEGILLLHIPIPLDGCYSTVISVTCLPEKRIWKALLLPQTLYLVYFYILVFIIIIILNYFLLFFLHYFTCWRDKRGTFSNRCQWLEPCNFHWTPWELHRQSPTHQVEKVKTEGLTLHHLKSTHLILFLLTLIPREFFSWLNSKGQLPSRKALQEWAPT